VTFAQTLSLRLRVQNRARHPILFEEALHSYFAISDISDVAISGLAGTTYIDKTDAARRKQQIIELVTITAETDRVYLDTPRQCVIKDRGWRRSVVIEKDGAASTVVWNPWGEKAAAMADLGDPVWRGLSRTAGLGGEWSFAGRGSSLPDAFQLCRDDHRRVRVMPLDIDDLDRFDVVGFA
jgi:glucose-6-phosphate 1-epimerase